MPASHETSPKEVAAFGGQSSLGESARWHAGRREFTCVDALAGVVFAWDLPPGFASEPPGAPRVLLQDPDVTPLCLPYKQGYLVGLRDTVVELKPGDRQPWASVELPPGQRFNDGALDSAGRLLIGSMGDNAAAGAGVLWSLAPDQPPRQLRQGLSVPNGIAWNRAGDQVFWIDSRPGVLTVTDYDQTTGEFGADRATWKFDTEPGTPDGMVADQDTLLIAMWDGQQVIRISQRDGTILDRYPVPVQRPTSCAVVDDHLVITSARVGLTELDPAAPDGQNLIIPLRARGS